MRIQVFEGGKIDADFLQDVLNHRKSSKHKYALQSYMKKNGMMLSGGEAKEDSSGKTKGGDTKQGKTKNDIKATATPDQNSANEEFFKIKEDKCYITVDNILIGERIFVVSNVGVYILKPSTKPE